MTIAAEYADLFEGNRSAVGTEDGGCARLSVPSEWDARVEEHLYGRRAPIGVYPMVPAADEWRVKWGCVDFDAGETESWEYAKRTHLLLKAFSVVSWVERSRSKGFHVWVFSRSFVPARTMRLALLVCVEGAAAPTTEVNPKQATLREGQLGNYVRLPYPGSLGRERSDGRRVVVDPVSGDPIGLYSFVEGAHNSRVDPHTLESLSEHYRPPQRPIRRRDWSGLPRTSDGIAGFAYWVKNLPEGNRNNGLFWAARECLDQGVQDLEPLVEAAMEAGLSEYEAMRTVESALKAE